MTIRSRRARSKTCRHIPKLGNVLWAGDELLATALEDAQRLSDARVLRVVSVKQPQQNSGIDEMGHQSCSS
jgi:hypothetical protein